MAPHFASELWSGFVSAPNRINTSTEEIKWDQGVLEQTWPEVDFNYCLELVCMVSISMGLSTLFSGILYVSDLHDDVRRLLVTASIVPSP
jgi:hypothetical protein